MVLKSLEGLKFVQKPIYTHGVDPRTLMRSRFLASISKQIELATNSKTEGRRWFSEANGKYVVSLRYRNSPIDINGKGSAWFELPSKEAIVKTLKAVQKEVEAGEWDEVLEKKSGTMKVRGTQAQVE